MIFKPDSKSLPGVSSPNVPLADSKVCLRFTFLDIQNSNEYQETIIVTKDKFGIINSVIGYGNRVGGYANSFVEV